jgi:kinesin family protein 11
VFGPEADQELVYESVAKPFVNEVLSGFNCTIFAYGQTGTGKTHTITGSLDNGNSSAGRPRPHINSGIIPRILYDLFAELAKLESGEKRMSMIPGGQERSDWAVKASYVELYNEELQDLLDSGLDGDKKPVKIFDDATRKGTIMQGMEECYIKNIQDGLQLLRQGAHNRQTAATKCNDLSSRSHCVFTLTVHTREIDSKSGEERVHIGKLNVVDLAGSENISRSGATNTRAREAGMINQSLLTLGRVINALVERSPHVPYRESKLTRILQDSLGGSTKTAIVATVSPAKVSLDETLSTLEYASRAKNIQNKPEANASLSKQMHILDYVREIERLKGDLRAVRERNGVYLTQESYDSLVAESESRKNLLDEQRLRLDLVETQLREAKSIADQYNITVDTLTKQADEHKKRCEALEIRLHQKDQELIVVRDRLEEEQSVSRARYEAEQRLQKVAQSFQVALQSSQTAVHRLHDKLNRARVAHEANIHQLRLVKETVNRTVNELQTRSEKFGVDVESVTQTLRSALDDLLLKHTSLVQSATEGLNKQDSLVSNKVSSLNNDITDAQRELFSFIGNVAKVKDDIIEEFRRNLAKIKGHIDSGTELTISHVGSPSHFALKHHTNIRLGCSKTSCNMRSTLLESCSRNLTIT